ncbi:phosphatidylinositol 4-kinase-like protein STT4 [Microthyrium microscopicum]|uniref:1-phosphatidylinositol 4-kinase n=1 Tax=Microthyrium microscopicum TaxID=703497 RepID=A0A6A6UJH8_9PEZI|nr:phosphatidylinositol 4-kinase-like protein STT4 [Microthyrium microscopicum]
MRTLRRDALEKLAQLSAAESSPGQQKDVARLCRRCPGPRSRLNNGADTRSGPARIPMGLPELEALLALCKAAPLVTNIEIAAQLLAQLTSYLPESHVQNLNVPFSLLKERPSPWEALTYSLCNAILSLGLNHPSLRQHAASTISRYVTSWLEVAHTSLATPIDTENDAEFAGTSIGRIVTLAVSLLGFLEAAAAHARFWTPRERIQLVRFIWDALSEKYMIALETCLSIIRNTRDSDGDMRTWKHYSRRYAADGRPLGAMILRVALMELVTACAALQVASPQALEQKDIMELLLSDEPFERAEQPTFGMPIEQLAEISADEMKLLEEGSDYLRLGSAWQQRLASAVRANVFKTYLCCSVLDEEIADPDALLIRLESTMSDPAQILDEYLASVVFKSMATLAKSSSSLASNISRSLSRAIVYGGLDSKTAAVAAECLASVLLRLPQDATITTLYSLGNVLSAQPENRNLTGSPDFDGHGKNHRHSMYPVQNGGSVVSFGPDEPSLVHMTTIEAIVKIASTCGQDKIIALALSMLLQKYGKVNNAEVDAKIITETAFLGVKSAPSELRSLLKMYSRLCHDGLIKENDLIQEAVMQARLHLSHGIKRGTEAFEIYIVHLLDSIVSKGDAHEIETNSHVRDVELAAHEIAQLLRPLAALAAANASPDAEEDLGIEGFLTLQRDAWFNAVVHGFTLTSPFGIKYRQEMQVLAQFSRPLIPEDRADHLESDIELNTTLRRGKSQDHVADFRRYLFEVLPESQIDLRELNYSELVFLASAFTMESLRAMSGDCTRVLTYFLDPRLRSGPLGNCMVQVANRVVMEYINRTLAAKDHMFSAPYIAQQLALFFAGCCHRIHKVQYVAIHCADLIIKQVPSSLCHKSSLFALLELLSIMWFSCLEREIEEYEWQPKFTSERGKVEVELSDDYAFRRTTLVELHKWARIWMLRVLDIAPLDIKGLIQTYLSDYDDEGSFGHVSLGRSFALEMGGMIPSTDQRLHALDNQSGLDINTASEFMAQYTTRQEYRFVEGLRDDDQDVAPFPTQRFKMDKSIEDARLLLADIESRTTSHQNVSMAEIRDVLRRAGALLCRTDKDEGAIVHHLVGIPFAVLSRQSIKLGISLWTGVIKENARMESRILAEIAECWENTVRQRRGLFDRRLLQQDPFYTKQEFAPSDRNLISRRQKLAHDLISPHLRLIQFLSSHFNASRLGTPHIQRIYQRIINVTLDALADKKCPALTREAHFHIVLLALRILRASPVDAHLLWRSKDRVLSAALSWFASKPQWSFGGNRLQIKAETHLLGDIHTALEKVAYIGAEGFGSRRSLQSKQELLYMLLANEQTRLIVWLHPLDHERKHHLHHFISNQHSKPPSDTAWAENPEIAVQLAHRFQSPALTAALRFLLTSFPEKVLNDPDALELLLGSSLPIDVGHQLKVSITSVIHVLSTNKTQYLLYWVSVNPITAVHYFLPAYGNNAFIVQYAMRALESHSVDTTFFYVPQIVQALRYDMLGYVERYIIETARLSQLFAHQIIWNMKANAFKDEESLIPDPVKPTLDKVLESLIASFTPADKDFYEREFQFFDEVTDISGKLKPYIKRSKPEKKQKIEEELRKIQVEVGVYLPSNPDGVVIGIDRKSGKPLQSHAKAPYMATFRIRKEKEVNDEADEMLIKTNGHSANIQDTYEVWQSAIFKVGDDCRQDVLALQLIAAFRGIFHSVGLDVYVNPYRVTATAPGCGVIDVLPNSISRDMLGREAVNGLYDYFISKYGGEDSIRFQEARNNFVKSMAAYSVISFLLQFKDRHNGNIMIDDAGHILHIDFGFCFDIVPGGVKFERAPFKLTAEMLAVMGGPNAQSYMWFEELCIKAFLCSRPHAEHLANMVSVMLDSGLPCFKPATMQHLRERFVLERSEREAADFMRDLIRKSANNLATKGYDHFQLLTNGIPY